MSQKGSQSNAFLRVCTQNAGLDSGVRKSRTYSPTDGPTDSLLVSLPSRLASENPEISPSRSLVEWDRRDSSSHLTASISWEGKSLWFWIEEDSILDFGRGEIKRVSFSFFLSPSFEVGRGCLLIWLLRHGWLSSFFGGAGLEDVFCREEG